MIKNQEFDDMIKDLSLRKRIPVEVLLKVWKSQFEFAREIIQKIDNKDIKNFKIVYFRRLGKFAPYKEKIYKINEARERLLNNGA